MKIELKKIKNLRKTFFEKLYKSRAFFMLKRREPYGSQNGYNST